VCGTYFVQAGTVTTLVWFSAIPIGVLAMAILVVNNLRDIDTDRVAGKKTLAVRFGANAAKAEYGILVAIAYLMPIVLAVIDLDALWTLAVWLSIPIALPLWRIVRTAQGRPLNAALGGTAQLEFIYALLFAAGLIASRVL
jgi:1,4-dihydroxy-2-naphthoate octaprenyltransferase